MLIEGTENIPRFEALDPLTQLSALKQWVSLRPKKRKFEENLIANYDYLMRVVEAIDLREAAKRFDADELGDEMFTGVPVVQRMNFLRFCKRHGLGNAMGDPERFLKPFMRCAKKVEDLYAE